MIYGNQEIQRDPTLGLSTAEAAAVNKSLSWYAAFNKEAATDVIAEAEEGKERLAEIELEFNQHRNFYENIGVHSAEDLLALRARARQKD